MPTGRNGAAEKPSDNAATTEKGQTSTERPPQPGAAKSFFQDNLALPDWVTPHYKQWKSWKLVIRCSVAAWSGLILLLVYNSERQLGQAAFLVLIVAFIMPPSNALAPALAQYAVSTLFIGFAWGYCCVGVRIAWLARSRFQYSSQAAFGQAAAQRFLAQGVPAAQIQSMAQQSIFNAEYIEAGSSVVCAVWYGLYCAIALWLRGYIGPSPYLFGIILSIIITSIMMLYSPLFPYEFYSLGWTFFLPYICQVAINIVCTLVIFPESLHHQFLEKLVGVVSPLRGILQDQENLLATQPGSPEWAAFAKNRGTLGQAAQGLGMLAIVENLLENNITFQRASGKDLQKLLMAVRQLVGRTAGFVYFQDNLQKHTYSGEAETGLDALMVHMRPSRPASPASTPASSRPASLHEDQGTDAKHHHHHHKHSRLHELRHARQDTERRKQSRPVGFVESQRYMLLEQQVGRPQDLEILPDLIKVLRSSSMDLIRATDNAAGHVIKVMCRMKSTSSLALYKTTEEAWGISVQDNKKVIEVFRAALEQYRQTDRLEVVKMFGGLFDPDTDFGSPSRTPNGSEHPRPSHRGLYWIYSYQWALMQYAEAVLSLVTLISGIEEKRRYPRFYLPQAKKLSSYLQGLGDGGDQMDQDPSMIAGLEERDHHFRKRDPDVLPPKNARQRAGVPIWRVSQMLKRPDVLFAIKAGIFSTLGAFPAFFASTASFFYHNRGLWVSIMVTLTMNQFVGDTVYQFATRVVGTFAGATVGLVIWYIGNGNSSHQPYGTAAVCAVAFPMLYFYRLFNKVIVQGILTTVTVVLIVGYSWQDATAPSAANPGWGWQVAWRRFLLVLIGITIAVVASYIPPRSTQKKTIRKLYAKGISSSTGLLFQLISLNVNKSRPIPLPHRIAKSAVALKTRLLKSAMQRNTIRFEYSIRGDWPAKDYETLANLEVELIDLLTQFGFVICMLDKDWTDALLTRGRLNDEEFLANLSSTVSLLSTALKTGQPMPYYHAPLLEGFFKEQYRFAVPHESQNSKVPTHVTLDTLLSLDYLRFSCGVSLLYGIFNRLDKITYVIKQLAGEEYYVHGLHSANDSSEQPLLHDDDSEYPGSDEAV